MTLHILHFLFLACVLVCFFMSMRSSTSDEYKKYMFWQAVFSLGMVIVGIFINSGITITRGILLVVTILMFIQSRSYIPRLWEWIQWHTWYKLLSERPSKFDKYDKNK